MKKLLVLGSCLLLLNGCGKEEPIKTVDVVENLVEVSENADEDVKESFELINDSITLECGEELSDDVTQYVKTKHPENIEMSQISFANKDYPSDSKSSFRFPNDNLYNNIKTSNNTTAVEQTLLNYPYVNDGSYFVAFRDIQTDYYQYLSIDFVDTTPPTYKVETNELTIYLKSLTNSGVYLNSPAEDHFDFGLEFEDNTSIIVNLESHSVPLDPNTQWKHGGTRNNKPDSITNIISLDKISPELKSGRYEDKIIIFDQGNNWIEIPVTFNLVDEFTPENLEQGSTIQ